jgi:hypothetical protein
MSLQSKAVSLAPNSSPHLEDQVSVFTFLSDRVAQLYPQALSLSVSFHDSQGYPGGILTLLYTRVICSRQLLQPLELLNIRIGSR